MAHTRYVPSVFRPIDLAPEPATSSSIVRIEAHDEHQTGLFSGSRKRAFDEISGYDEDSFSRKHLATESSIHFRSRSDGPRSFLWRVLNNGLLLEIQCVDLVSEKKHSNEESSLTYHIAFASAIRSGGVVFADSEKTDALQAFVLTANNELTTVIIKKDLLVKTSVPKDVGSSTIIHSHHLSALSFRHPYKLEAVSSVEVVITLHDGGLLRLERESEDHHAQWKETHFSEGGWSGSLRGLISLKRQQTVRYAELDLDPSAVVSIAKSPDNNYLWTVTLDHSLNAWDQRSGKVVLRRDLLGGQYEQDEKKKQPRYVMPAEQGALLQLIPPSKETFLRVNSLFDEDSQYHIVVFSPKDHCFKIFCGAISTALVRADSPIEGEPPRLFDFLDGHELHLPFDDLLNTNLWRVAEFHFKAGYQWNDSQIWVRVQCGASSRTFHLKFDLFNNTELAEDLQSRWQHGWTVVEANDYAEIEQDGPLAGHNAQGDPANAWLRFLFYPGRFSESSLETTLHLYSQRRKLSTINQKDLQTSRQPLEARLTAAIARGVDMPRTASDKPDYKQYYLRLQAQWTGYYSILQDIHKRRLDLLRIAVDDRHGLAWTVAADTISPIRLKDKIEMLTSNSGLDGDDEQYDKISDDVKVQIVSEDEDWDTMKILVAAQVFAASLPQPLRQSFAEFAVKGALSNHQSPDDFFSATDIGRQVSDESYQNLEITLQPLNGIGGLTDGIFTTALDHINTVAGRGAKTGFALNRYGSRAMVAVAQQLIRRDKTVLLNLLALITFIHNDFERDNLDEDLHLETVFSAIMKDLKQLELRDWLIRTVCLEPSRSDVIRSTVFETLFIGDWDSHASKDTDFTSRLTHWSRQWAFAAFQDWRGFTANIFATLLKHNLVDTALDFEHFLERSAWTTYLKARLYLAVGRHDEAAILFSSTADELAGKRKGELDTAGFLSAEERAGLGAGQDQYLMHVANLFEKQQLYSYTAEFATRALSFINERHVDRELHEIDKRRSVTESPLDKVADARAEVQLLKINATWEEITGRLFSAQLLTGRFESAFATLAKMKRPDLKRSNLHRLVEAMLSHGNADVLLSLPLDHELADEADNILAQLAQKSLLTGTSKRGPQQILYAFRVRRGDYRGAAQILYGQLERLRHSQRKHLHDPEEDTLPQAYLVLINTLACCGEGEEWLLTDPIPDVHPTDARRKLVTLESIRREYVSELDKRSDLQHGRFPLIGGGGDGDAMDTQ